MKPNKNNKTNARKPSVGTALNASLAVEIERDQIRLPYDAHPLSGRVLYVLDRDLSEILKENRSVIWKDFLRRDLYPDNVRGGNISAILRGPDNPRKYPAALICTAEKLSRITPLINGSYAKALDTLRIRSVRFFVIDVEGKAKIENLKAGIYFVCGVGETRQRSGVWNVRVELKPGKNSLKLDSKNLIGRQNL